MMCKIFSGTGTSLIDLPSLSIIVISATAGLMVTCCSTSPGRVVRLRKKFSEFSKIISLFVISTKKHCCRCVFENGPTSWLLIGVKSLLPGDIEWSKPVTVHIIHAEWIVITR